MKFDAARIVKQKRARQFPCPSCNQELLVSPQYVKVLVVFSLILSCLTTYLIGVSDPFNFLAACLGIWFAFIYLLSTSLRRIVPPRVQIYYPEDLSLDLSKKQR